MNDPLRPKDKPAPRRAEPLQPDAPTRGTAAEPERDPGSPSRKESLDRALEQERTALHNVRDT